MAKTTLYLTLACVLTVPTFAQRELSGSARITIALKDLQNTGSALMIAAHPDDENSALLAYLARGRHVRTGYLSLTRGEGGQNLIGAEQGYELGLIRTQELLAARRIDGAQQFFTTAVDFGFSKTPEETLRIWGHDKMLGEVLQTIRNFRPDVIILRFSGTPRDGHGQHQASALLAKEAFAKLSTEAWHPRRVMWNMFGFNAAMNAEAAATPGRIAVDPGEYDPVLGFSYAEIAGMSRSMHKSQGFGAAERKGSLPTFLITVAGDVATKDIFDGVDTRWNRIAGGAEVARILAKAEAAYQPENPTGMLPLLIEARALAAKLQDPLARRKLPEFDEVIRLCAGVWLDATVDNPVQVEGKTMKLNLEAIDRSHTPVLWDGKPLEFNQPARSGVEVKAESGVQATMRVRIDAQALEFTQPILRRWVDPVRGELTRPLVVVPPLAVHVADTPLLFLSQTTRDLSVGVQANEPGVAGDLRLVLPAGWKSEPASRSFKISESGQQISLAFRITPPAGDSTESLRAVAKLSDGREVAVGLKVIDYPHIPPQTWFPPATTKLVRADVKTLAKAIGYVMGAGDEMPAALQQMGCTVTMLSDEDLAHGELSGYDAIVTGLRAYDMRPAVRTYNKRLLDYVAQGGTLVVQYNKLNSERGDVSKFSWGPYPFEFNHDRVTVEDAPVEFTAQSRLLQIPNKIGARDFEGWVQERGLYFASKWDPQYRTLFSTHDPGEAPLLGSTLYTPYGKGMYVYTAFAWFRQLPAGVPGAYRLFANMISAGKAIHE